MKEWIGWTGGGAPKQLRYADGSITNSPKKIADMMVNYYSQKVKNIQKENPCSGDPLERVREMMRGKECVFKLREVTEDEVSGAVRRMKNSSALGADNIPADLFKKTIKFTKKAITYMINLSTKNNDFATLWKISKVIPLLKPDGDHLNPKDFRPVSLLGPLSRLVEMLVCIQVMKYLEDNCLLHSSIHGYGKDHSCASAIIEMYNNAIVAQESGEW